MQTSKLPCSLSISVMALAFKAFLAASRILCHPVCSREPGPPREACGTSSLFLKQAQEPTPQTTDICNLVRHLIPTHSRSL